MVLEIPLDLDQQRLASSALTEWLSISLTCTSLNQPVCMMQAIPIAVWGLRALMLAGVRVGDRAATRVGAGNKSGPVGVGAWCQ